MDIPQGLEDKGDVWVMAIYHINNHDKNEMSRGNKNR